MLDKMLELLREIATLVSKLVAGHFDNRERVLQDWLSIRPGCVVPCYKLVKMGCFVGVPLWAICLPGQSQTGSQD